MTSINMMYHQRRGYRPCFHHISVLLLFVITILKVYYIPKISAFTIQNRYQHNSAVHYSSLLQQQQYHPSRRYKPHHYNIISRTILSTSSIDNNIEDDEDEEEEELPPIIDGYNLFDDEDITNTLQSKEELQLMTVNQLKQQLRLRGKKITGNKVDLIHRLLDNSVVDATIIDSSSENGGGNDRMTNGYTKYEKSYATLKRNSLLDINDDDNDEEEEDGNNAPTTKYSQQQQQKKKKAESKRVAEAKSRGGDIVDVTEYINPDEVGKSFKSLDAPSSPSATSTSTQDIDYEEVNDEFSIDVDIINTTSSKSSSSTKSTTTNDSVDNSDDNGPEVWGEDARIVKDYEGKAIVVDGLSRTIIEYKGCNDVLVQAYVVGSRMAMSNFLKGGTSQSEDDNDGEGEGGESEERNKYKSMEEEVYAIQSKRELESKRGLTQTMLDNDDFETGQEDPTDEQSKELYSTVERDYGDWGVYTPTGAQLSSTEVQGVLLLSDVYGAFTDSTQTLADKIAFECQPVFVTVPDMFRGDPWSEERVNDSDDDVERQTIYEEWRAKHPEYRVDIDIRAAASVLRERYAVSSIAIWGTCYGGGRALEAAAGWYPDCTSTSYYEEMNSSQSKPPPPHVDPVAAIAWYPTRYNTKQLFGKENEGYRTFHNGNERKVAIMAVFAGNDVLPGATPDDANLLKECLETDPRVVDYMVKIFPNQEHGFAHNHLGVEKPNDATSEEVSDDALDDRFLGEDFGSSIEPLEMGGDAEVACLLSTAWMETYTRVFLPTVGTPVRYDENEEWSSTIEMNKRTEQRPDIRSEIDDAIFKFDDVDVDIGRMSQSASPLLEDGPGIEKYEQIEEERERIRQEILEKYNISDDDDEETFDKKFKQAQADGALDGLLLDAYLDDSGDAYW